MLNLCMFLFSVLLFFLLTPDIILPKPTNTNKYVIALVHAILFSLLWQLFNKLFRNNTEEGFESTKPAIASSGSKAVPAIKPADTVAAQKSVEVANTQAVRAAQVAATAAATAKTNPTAAAIANAQATAATAKAAALVASNATAAAVANKAGSPAVPPVNTKSSADISAIAAAKKTADDAAKEAKKQKEIADASNALSISQTNVATKAENLAKLLEKKYKE